MSRNLYHKNIPWITIILAALMLSCFLPTLALAHDDDIASPDGLVAPLPPELPTPSPQQTLYQIDSTESQAQCNRSDPTLTLP